MTVTNEQRERHIQSVLYKIANNGYPEAETARIIADIAAAVGTDFDDDVVATKSKKLAELELSKAAAQDVVDTLVTQISALS